LRGTVGVVNTALRRGVKAVDEAGGPGVDGGRRRVTDRVAYDDDVEGTVEVVRV